MQEGTISSHLCILHNITSAAENLDPISKCRNLNIYFVIIISFGFDAQFFLSHFNCSIGAVIWDFVAQKKMQIVFF